MTVLDSALDLTALPRHIAVIMDGNGRWASARGLPRHDGHLAGADSVEDVIQSCGDLGIEYLTLYAFSSENWKRPAVEVDAIMALLAHFLAEKAETLIRDNIRLRVIGNLERIPLETRELLEDTISLTAGNTRLTLIVALGYGAREEIVEATRNLMEKARIGELAPADLDQETFACHLSTVGIPDPDLLIRSSGEYRISNFLLWQISYTEIVISEVLWPDFRREHLEAAIIEYQHRHRRYGGL